MNFPKFLRTPFLQNTLARLLLKWNKTTCLPLLIAFSSLSDINTTLKIDITTTWSFTLRYVIAKTPLWCWKKISYNYATSISICNRSISRCKSDNIGCPLGWRLCHIWRIRNTKAKRFTFNQQHSSGFIQRRLDHIFVSSGLQKFLSKTDILPPISTDHSPVLFNENAFGNSIVP